MIDNYMFALELSIRACFQKLNTDCDFLPHRNPCFSVLQRISGCHLKYFQIVKYFQVLKYFPMPISSSISTCFSAVWQILLETTGTFTSSSSEAWSYLSILPQPDQWERSKVCNTEDMRWGRTSYAIKTSPRSTICLNWKVFECLIGDSLFPGSVGLCKNLLLIFF